MGQASNLDGFYDDIEMEILRAFFEDNILPKLDNLQSLCFAEIGIPIYLIKPVGRLIHDHFLELGYNINYVGGTIHLNKNNSNCYLQVIPTYPKA